MNFTAIDQALLLFYTAVGIFGIVFLLFFIFFVKR